MNSIKTNGKRTPYALYLEDQRERKRVFGIHGTGSANGKDIQTLAQNDKKRLDELRTYLLSHKLRTGRDFYAAAMLLQHGITYAHYKKAHMCANISAKLGYKPAKWLSAATLDRYLKSIGRKQKYGTQFYLDKKNNWKIWPYLKKTTDEERIKLDVEPLAKLFDFAKKLNSRSG